MRGGRCLGLGMQGEAYEKFPSGGLCSGEDRVGWLLNQCRWGSIGFWAIPFRWKWRYAVVVWL